MGNGERRRARGREGTGRGKEKERRGEKRMGKEGLTENELAGADEEKRGWQIWKQI